MKSIDEILKMRATLLYILEKCGGELDYVKLYKLLYFAQQLHLVRYGRGIFNDSFYARDRGPIPGFIYTGVKYAENHRNDNRDLDLFSNGIEITKEKHAKQTMPTDMDEFSASDLECLDEILNKYGALSSDILSEISHQDSAWLNADRRRQMDPEQNKMSRIEIAKAGGASGEMLDYIRYKTDLDLALSR